MSTARYLIGDTRAVVATLPDNSVDLILSSPPFLALRSYLPSDDPNKGLEIGQEPNPAAFLDVLLELTAGWRRVLAPHGSIAIELGDTYSGSTASGGDEARGGRINGDGGVVRRGDVDTLARRQTDGWPLAKSLALVPELYRIALAYGINPLTGQPSPAGRWRVRNVVRWHRPNPPVGALGDKFRPSTSDMVIACVSDRRWFDLDAVREPYKPSMQAFISKGSRTRQRPAQDANIGSDWSNSDGVLVAKDSGGAPPLDTWVIPTESYPGSHYATFPRALCVKPIKSMCPERVCRVCGEPSRRIVGDAEYLPSATNRGGVMVADAERVGEGVNGWRGANGAGNASVVRSAPTLGWTDCGCSTDGTHWRPGVVLDPFGGSGTTGAVATGLGRDAILIDLDARNADLARDRIGMFLDVAEGVA